MAFIKHIIVTLLRAAKYAIGLGLAVLIAIIALAGFTSFGAGILAPWIASAVSQPGREITISGPGPLLTGELRVQSVSVADEKGTYATIDGIALDWSPLSLLEFTFDADRLEVDSVSVTRKPDAPQTTTPASNGGFSLPVKLDIDSLLFPHIALNQNVLGRTFDLSISGNLVADSNAISSKIAVKRNDGAGGTLDADIVFSPDDDRLKLDARFSEPEGGVLAGLLRLPSNPSVDVAVVGEGPLSEWTGDISGTVDGQQTVDIKATHRQSKGGPHQLTVTGGGQLATLLPPALRPAFAGTTSIDLAVDYAEDGRLDLQKADIASGSLTLTGSGTLDPSGDNDLTASLKGVNGPIDFRWPMGEHELAAAIESVDLTARGPASAVNLDLSASLNRLTVPQADLRGVSLSARSATFDLGNRTGALDVVLSVNASAFTNPSLERALKAPVTVKAPVILSADKVAVEAATIESATVGGTATGQYALDTQELDAQIKLFALPSVLPEGLAGKFTGTIEIAGNVNYQQPTTVTVDGLTVKSNLGSITGNASYEDDALTANFTGELSNLSTLMDKAEGKADFSLDASGPLDALDAKAEISIDQAKFAGYELKGFELQASGKADPDAPTGTATASGSIDGQSIDLSAELKSENGRAVLPQFEANVGENRITGNLSFSPDFQPEGAFQFDFPKIALLAALAGQNVEGDLKGKVELGSTNGSIRAKVEASGSRIERDGTLLSGPSISLDIPDAKALALNGTLKASSLALGTNKVSDIALAFERQSSATEFDLEAQYDKAPVTVKGSIEQDEQLSIALQEASATPQGIKVTLADPVTLKIADGGVAFQDLKIKAGDGTISASGNAGSELDVNGRLDALPASLVNRFVPSLSAAGTISGTVTANGKASSPSIGYDLKWSDAAIAQTRSANLPALTINAKGQFANSKVTVQTELSGVSGLTLSGGGSVGITGNKPLDMRFSGDLPFGVLAGQLAGQGLVLEGAAAVNVNLAGSAQAPQISGSINTNGARLIDTRRNLAVENLSASIAMNGNTARIENLTGQLTGGGKVTASGTIDILSPNLPADLTVKMDQAAYADGTIFSTTASGDMTVKGPLLASPTLSGAVNLGETAITIPERLPPTLRQLDIEHRNAPADVRKQMAEVNKTESHGSSSDLALDLKISAPARNFVRGRGIDAELGGSLTIRGTASNPIVSGGFTLTRGRLMILTRRLDFTSGKITFGGNLIPRLDMTATTTSGSTTITTSIEGLADDPQITFSSSPALPQDEILAQLIFGQSIAKLSPLQIAQLADAASQLAGGNSTSLLNSLRSGLGVDNLDITTDSQGNASVSAGKYLNDRTYLELQQSGEGTGKAVINLDIGRGVKLRGEAGGDGSGAAGIFYEKEY